MEKFQKLENAIAQHGCRATARRLVNELLIKVIGIDLDSFADTSDICNEIDEIEDLLSNKFYVSALAKARLIAIEISENIYEYL